MTSPIPHGGGLIAARLRAAHAHGDWIDLSTGINPVAYPVPPAPASIAARLPELEQVAALEAIAARAYGVADSAAVVAAPGAQALIHLLPRLLSPRSVTVVSPTYAEHAAAWSLAGHRVSESPDLATASSVAVVVRPNNPDGQVGDAGALLAFAHRLAASDGLLVVDESFADLEGCSLAPALPRAGLLLLRSFGKTYGLAGLRLGFALTNAKLAATLRQALGPWAVSGPALHAGLHALPDASWRAAAADRLASDARRLDGLLVRAGAALLGGTKLFRLIRHERAPALADHLEAAAILVRRFERHPDHLRLGMPQAGAWGRLDAALNQWTAASWEATSL